MTDAAMALLIFILMGLIFMLINWLVDNPVIGVSSGIIAVVVRFMTGGWWLSMETAIPGIAILFWGIGVVNLITTANGDIRLLMGRIHKDEDMDEGVFI